MLTLIAYRGIFNAFLSIKLVQLPYNTWEDVLDDNDVRVIISSGQYQNEQFMFAPEGSLYNKVFEQKIADKPSWKDLGGSDGAKKELLKGKAVYYGDTNWLFKEKAYPCSIMTLSTFRFVFNYF